MLVTVDPIFAAFAVCDRHRDDLLRERPVGLSVDGAPVRVERELILLGARDRVFAAEVFGRLEHSPRDRIVEAAGRYARAREAIVQLGTARAGAPAQRDRVQLRLAHALGAAGEHELGRARLNAHRRVDHRLQPGAAAAVDLEPWSLDRQAGVERRDAADRRRLAVRVALAEQYVVDLVGRQLRALQQLSDHGPRELLRRYVLEDPAEPADGRSQRLADHRLSDHHRSRVAAIQSAMLCSVRGSMWWADGDS